jgi:hypothetical protein
MTATDLTARLDDRTFGKRPVYRSGYRVVLDTADLVSAGASNIAAAIAIGGPTGLGEETPPVPADPNGDTLSGLVDLRAGDGVRLLFLGTPAATNNVALLTALEPVVDDEGTILGYIERSVSGPAVSALTLGTQAIGTDVGGALGIPTTMVFAHQIGALVTNQSTASIYSPGGNLQAHLDFKPAEGLQFLRVQAGADADARVVVLARMLRGNALNA